MEEGEIRSLSAHAWALRAETLQTAFNIVKYLEVEVLGPDLIFDSLRMLSLVAEVRSPREAATDSRRRCRGLKFGSKIFAGTN